MSYNPYGGRYTYGGSLKHYRPKGSRNGYSTVPGYNPVGKKAVGIRQPDGSYRYYDPNEKVFTKYPNSSVSSRAAQEAGARNYTAQRRKDARIKRLRDTEDKIARNKVTMQQRESGQRMISSREEQQRKGNRINANAYGNTFGNAVGREITRVGAKGRKVVTDVKKGAKKTGSNIGNWLNERRRDVTNWFNQAGDNLRNGTVKRSVTNWFDRAGDNVRKAGKTAYEAISNSDERKAYEQAQANFRKNPSAENKRARDAAKKAYDSHLLTKLGRGVNKAARDTRDWVNQAGDNIRNGNVKKAVTNFGDRVGDRVREGAKSVGKAISNQDERKAYEQAQAAYRKDPTPENRKRRNEAKKALDTHLLTRAERGVKGAAISAKKTARNVADTVSGSAKNVREFASARAGEFTSTVNKLSGEAKTTAKRMIDDIKSGKTQAEIQAASIELENFLRNQLGNGYKAPSDDYLDRVTKKKK